MKKSIFLAIALVLFSVALVAQATPGLSYLLISSETGLESGSGDAYAVKRGTASATHIVIPAE